MKSSLGKYEIQEPIGSGGFGTVYRAVDPTLRRRPVAIKVLAPHLISDPQIVTRFIHEAGIAANLQHPNIVTIYEVGEDQGAYFLAMQLIEGKPLAEILQETGALPIERVITIVAQLADAIDYAHTQGVLHRDIKLSNILIGKNDHVTLTDFGLARATETSGLTTRAQFLGTPTYMAPEQLDVVNPQPASARVDIYALGIVVYEMLAGRPPFVGNTLAVVSAHLQTTPPPIHQFNPSVSDVISRAVLGTLEKDPAVRYPSTRALSEALKQSTPQPMIVPQRPPFDPPYIPPRHSARDRWSRLSKWVAVSIGGIALIAALLFGLAVILEVGLTLFIPPATRAPNVPSMTRIPDSDLTRGSEALSNGESLVNDAVMVFIPAGDFTMGNDSGGYDERPVHTVYLDAFWMDKYEVTNMLYKKCVTANKCAQPKATNSRTRQVYYGNAQYDNHPVINVTWYDAVAYCAWVGKRLPTEAEWEKTSRGTDKRIFP